LSTLRGTADRRMIAYLGDGHGGDVDTAKRLVELAISAGCDGVVLPVRNVRQGYAEEAHAQPAPDAQHNALSLGAVLQELELSVQELKDIREICRGRVDFIGAPYDLQSFADLEATGPDGYQIDPAVLKHTPLLEAIKGSSKPVLLVAGGCTEKDIEASVAALDRQNVTLLHCVYASELELEATSLWLVSRLRERFGLPMGYLGLEPRISGAIAAFAMGAGTVEKLFSIDGSSRKGAMGAGLDRDELRELAATLRKLQESLSGETSRIIFPDELGYSDDPRASLVAGYDLPAGVVIEESMLVVKLAAHGVDPSLLDYVKGRKLAYDVPADAPLTFGAIES